MQTPIARSKTQANNGCCGLSRVDELLARSSQVKVAVNMDTWEKVAIPAAYRQRFADCKAEP